MSRQMALLIGLTVVLLTGIICGGILWKHLSADASLEETTVNAEPEAGVDAEKEMTEETKTEAELPAAEPEAENVSEETAEDPVPAVSEDQLVILKDPPVYTYEDLEADSRILKELYPETFSFDSLGTTLDGRQLYHFVIGNPDAEEKIFINAGIHAREYITCQLVMKQTAVFLSHLKQEDTYAGTTYQEMLQGRNIQVVCMVNPDGIAISQSGWNGIQTDTVRASVEQIAGLDGTAVTEDYLRRWKANGNGVDLNRNFDALWDQYAGSGHPSADHYKGTAPGCEPEAAALIALTQREQFARTISYHTQGQVVYWYFAQTGTLYEDTKRFAERISGLTGYPMDANYENLDPAGYKDWAIREEGIPSLTIEVGTTTSPVPSEQFSAIWEQNRYVWEETILDMIKN